MKFSKNILILLILIISNVSFAEDGKFLFKKYGCGSCHSPTERLAAPSFKEIRERYGKSKQAIDKVAKLIIKPNPSNWPGFAYMPPFNIPYEDARKLAEYVLIYSEKEKPNQTKSYDLESDHY
jgi:Cytochrome c551/c552